MFRRSFAIVPLLLGFACVSVGAGVITVPRSVQESEAAARDLDHTFQARRALLKDPELAPLNLGVRVRNRIAVLWGPVPSAELGFKAEICVRRLIELSEVRNEMFVAGADAPGVASPARPTELPPVAPPSLPGIPFDKLPGAPPPLTPVPPPAMAEPPPPVEDIEPLPMRLPRKD